MLPIFVCRFQLNIVGWLVTSSGSICAQTLNHRRRHNALIFIFVFMNVVIARAAYVWIELENEMHWVQKVTD